MTNPIQLFRLEMGFYFIHMAGTAGLTALNSIGPIFMNVFRCMESHLGNGITKVDLQILNCHWFAGITLFFNGVLQKIADSWWPIDISLSAN